MSGTRRSVHASRGTLFPGAFVGRRTLLLLAVALLVACTNDVPIYSSPTPVPTSTELPSNDYPSAAGTTLEFVQALNQQDYLSAFDLLSKNARDEVKDAGALREAYADARATATATLVTYALEGGLLQDGPDAVATLVSAWQTELFGAFTVTSTLRMTAQGDAWRVAWTRDLILPGLATGVLALQREVPQRGLIYAAGGSVLAAQNEQRTIGVRPAGIVDATEEKAMLAALSELTGLAPDDIKARYKDQPPNWFVPIATVDLDVLDQHNDLIAPFPAVIAREHFTRAYPQADVAPHVVGYMGAIPAESIEEYRARGFSGDERMGLSGVEGFMDEALAGKPGGVLMVVRSGDGATRPIATRPLETGRDVTLTISPTIQLAAQQLLGGRRGAVVVMDPRDGAIRAMASFPTFNAGVLEPAGDANERAQLLRDSTQPLVNRALQGAYPPGSTFKIVTMASGIAEGVTSPTDVFNDPGYWDGFGREYRKVCWLRGGHGRLTLQQGLSASCDIVFYNVGQRLDEKGQGLLSQYSREFGFGARTGVELIGESAGVLPDPDWKKARVGEPWTSGDTVNLAIGQGYMLATPLQIAQMTAAVANGGTLLRPHVVASISARGDTPAQTIGPEAVRKLPVSAEGLAAIQAGMAGVTTDGRIGTTTYRFSTFDYYEVDGRIVAGKNLTRQQRATATKVVVAGKSGTAQAPGVSDKPFAWFTAYAPAHDPKVVVTVLLENIGEGSAYAAPVARQVIEAYFALPLSTTPGEVRETD